MPHHKHRSSCKRDSTEYEAGCCETNVDRPKAPILVCPCSPRVESFTSLSSDSSCPDFGDVCADQVKKCCDLKNPCKQHRKSVCVRPEPVCAPKCVTKKCTPKKKTMKRCKPGCRKPCCAPKPVCEEVKPLYIETRHCEPQCEHKPKKIIFKQEFITECIVRPPVYSQPAPPQAHYETKCYTKQEECSLRPEPVIKARCTCVVHKQHHHHCTPSCGCKW